MFTIGQVLERHKRVVFDTSILDAGESPHGLRYRGEIRRAMKSDRLLTVKDVVYEAWTMLRHFRRDPLFERVQWHQRNLEAEQVTYVGFLEHLIKKAKEYEKTKSYAIINKKKDYPYTDVNVAALTMTLAHQFADVALVSSDRPLNELVLSECNNPTLPKEVHPIAVYSFFQKTANYVPYAEEKTWHPKSFPFTSSRSP
ncbi:MAG: hypothetical protein AABY01_02215 [Nanoarchaeota archaeon]